VQRDAGLLALGGEMATQVPERMKDSSGWFRGTQRRKTPVVAVRSAAEASDRPGAPPSRRAPDDRGGSRTNYVAPGHRFQTSDRGADGCSALDLWSANGHRPKARAPSHAHARIGA